jgi:hypothetical protein
VLHIHYFHSSISSGDGQKARKNSHSPVRRQNTRIYRGRSKLQNIVPDWQLLLQE